MSTIEDENTNMDPGRQEHLKQRAEKSSSLAFMLLVLQVLGRPCCFKSHRLNGNRVETTEDIHKFFYF